jgi:hypothetical protein
MPFCERGVIDREHLDHALMLFTQNVFTVLCRRQVEFCEEWNVLAKLSSLIDGKEFNLCSICIKYYFQ